MASQLQRFKDAQDKPISGYESALAEIRQGGKRSHWIWYVFPQLLGLGQSPAAIAYGLDGVDEAREYLRDPLLRSRLLTIAEAAAEQVGHQRTLPLARLMGSTIDATKLVSSMTLFGSLAKQLHDQEALDEYAALARAADEILGVAQAEGFRPCAFTLEQLTRSSRRV